jgi:hypothetical protein
MIGRTSRRIGQQRGKQLAMRRPLNFAATRPVLMPAVRSTENEKRSGSFPRTLKEPDPFSVGKTRVKNNSSAIPAV